MGGTVYLTAGDAGGQMVSFIQSDFSGSGVVVPGTGIHLQNRGAGFVLEPGHPNMARPRRRPFHTIKVVRRGRYVTFQMAEVVVPRTLFAEVLRLIAALRHPADTAPA